MKRVSADELLAQNPDVDPENFEESQRLSERLKEAGFERARYGLATPLTGKRHKDRGPDKGNGRHAERHAHNLIRRH